MFKCPVSKKIIFIVGLLNQNINIYLFRLLYVTILIQFS